MAKVINKNDELSEIKQSLLEEIDNRFKLILDEFNSLYNELLNKSNTQNLNIVKQSKEVLESALKEVDVVKKNVETQFSKASKRLDKASKILELNDSEINTDSIKDLFRVAYNNDVWINKTSKDVDRIVTEFKDVEDKLSEEEKQEGVITNIRRNIAKQDAMLEDIKIENEKYNKIVEGIKDLPLGHKQVKDTNLSNDNFTIMVDDDHVNISNASGDKIIINKNGIEIFGNVIINGREF
jgi:uncharacterized protein YoxC